MTEALTTQSDLRTLIRSDQCKKAWAAILPTHLTPERMARVALTALTKNPKLGSCTQQSVMGCLLDLASMGLEPDGRRAHLLPFKIKGVMTCTLIVDYKGLAELIMRSGVVSHIHADIICENDDYEENMGRVTKHVINRRKPRGNPYAAYSHVVMKDGSESFEIMSQSDIEILRDRSPGYQAAVKYKKTDNPWMWEPAKWEMWKKTVFRRHSKWLPLSPEFRDALDKDGETIDITGEIDIDPPVIEAPDTPDLQDGDAPDKEKEKAEAEAKKKAAAEKKKKAAEAKKAKEKAEAEKQEEPEPVEEPVTQDEDPPQEEEDNIPMDDEEETVPEGGPFAAPMV